MLRGNGRFFSPQAWFYSSRAENIRSLGNNLAIKLGFGGKIVDSLSKMSLQLCPSILLEKRFKSVFCLCLLDGICLDQNQVTTSVKIKECCHLKEIFNSEKMFF